LRGQNAKHKKARPTPRAAAGTAPFVAPALARLLHRERHGVTAVAVRSVRVNSSVAATGAPLRFVALGTGRAGERVIRWADGIFDASSTIRGTMTKIGALEREVEKLSRDELAAFREWFLEYDWQAWDRELEEDVGAGKLDKLAAEALEEHRLGKTKEI